jgi:hypothetical protein
MIFCARATRGLRRSSLDARNRGSTRPPFGDGVKTAAVLPAERRVSAAGVGRVRTVAFLSTLPMFVYCPNRAGHKVSTTPMVLLPHCQHNAGGSLDRCWGFQLFYSRVFLIIGFVSAL